MPEMKEVEVLSVGLVYASLCTENTLSPQEAAARYTDENPPGTSANQWVATAEADLPEGFWGETPEADRVYPAPCKDHPDTRQHLLVNC